MVKTAVKQCVLVVALSLTMLFLLANRRADVVRANYSNINVEAQDQGEKTSEQTFKNIQVLKGLPASQIESVMNLFVVSLGARCETCHVREGNNWSFEKDDKPAKKTAREMIQMVLNINKESFGGRSQVTCNTCHRGQNHPVAIPTEAQIKESKDRAATQQGQTGAQESLPTVDQVVDRYIQGLGGKPAIDELKNRFSKGVYTTHRTDMPVEVYQVAPNKAALIVTTPNGTISQVFNGSTGWFINGKNAQEIKGTLLEDTKQHLEFFPYINLKNQFQNLRVVRKDKIRDHDVYVVSGTAADKRRMTFAFDIQSGLLLRVTAITSTMMGNLPVMLDLDDYREVDGVKIPFSRHSSELDGFNPVTLKLSEVKHKIAIDDSRFNPGNF